MMSDFTDKESVRLKQALAHRNLQNQNSANEYQIKTTQGPTLWNATKEAAKAIVLELNEKTEHQLLRWEPVHANQIEVTAPEIGPEYKIKVTFLPAEFLLTWDVLSGQKGRNEMTLSIDRNHKICWKFFQSVKTAEEAAQKLIGELTSTI